MNGHLVSRSLLFTAIFVAVPSLAAAAVFEVRPGGDSKVVFVSKASMETFQGKTSRMTGTIDVDPSHLGDSATVRFEVDLASLDTGIGKRNQHMRDNHLETSKYPKAVFEGVAMKSPAGRALPAGKPAVLDVEGTFTLHGVSRRIWIRVETTYKPGVGGSPNRIDFRTTFPVSLADHAISRPQFLFLKLADVQEVRVSGVAVSAR